MGRDMTATGRYAPQPRHAPFAFYSSVRLADPGQLALIMATDPYFVTQDNGAGAPLHFATTYKQLDMMHHLLNNGAEVNQRDDKGMTPLHRAAYLAQYDGYLELYEYLLSRGADPSIRTEDYDPYLKPGNHLAIDLACEDESVRAKLLALDKMYAGTPKVREPHPDIGCWWTLYDYGLDTVKTWAKDYKREYPEEKRRKIEEAARKEKRAAKKAAKEAAAAGLVPAITASPSAVLTPPPANAAQSSSAHIVPVTPIAFVFPGQGSQAMGMFNATKDIPSVKAMLKEAEQVLGYDLLKLCTEGPKEKLDDTTYAQPALFVAGLAAVEKLRGENPAAVEGCSATAGLSLGEYTALVFAGAMSFKDGLKVVKARGESMAAAAAVGRPHGMLSVIGLSDEDLQAICKDVCQKMGPDTICQLANFLFPQGRVVSGHKDALEMTQRAAVAKGALKVTPLAVSGAFHTPLMKSAQDSLIKVLKEVTFSEPRLPVFSNVTAKPLSSAAEIPGMLARQLVEPVQWEDTLRALIAAGKREMFELGPGAQIKAMTKRIDTPVWRAFTNVAS